MTEQDAILTTISEKRRHFMEYCDNAQEESKTGNFIVMMNNYAFAFCIARHLDKLYSQVPIRKRTIDHWNYLRRLEEMIETNIVGRCRKAMEEEFRERRLPR